jgi:hypothetical protein
VYRNEEEKRQGRRRYLERGICYVAPQIGRWLHGGKQVSTTWGIDAFGTLEGKSDTVDLGTLASPDELCSSVGSA